MACGILPAAGQIAMDVRQTRYVVGAGQAVQIVAPRETVDFLANARSRHVEIVTGDTAVASGGLVAAPNRAGDQILLGASLRVKPGEYTVRLSATSAAGEQRQTTLAVEVQPRVSVPSGATRAPVVLLNGWETGFTGACPLAASSSDTFGSLAQYLVSDGVPVVYLFDNCLEDPGQPIEVLGNDLAAFLKTIHYDTGAQVPQIDLVGFSMGGLIARAYLAGLQPGETLTPPTTTLVGKLVLIATPNFGSFVAGTYAAVFAAGSQDSELEPGSAFLWNLATWNQRGDDLRGVDAIAVIGNAGTYTPNSYGTTLANASDGLVSLTSASLGFVSDDATVTRIVPYCHVDSSAFTNTALGTYTCNAAGIANVTSKTHYTGEIVRSFLAGTTAWKSIGTAASANPYLSKNGAMFFALVNSTGGYVADMTAVTFGTVSLSNGGDTGTIFDVDFVLGTGAFTAASASLGSIGCGMWAEPLGYTSALRCKLGPVIYLVGPLAETGELAVNAGTALTITGAGFGSQCIGCKVVATPAGSTTAQQLTTTAWSTSGNSITANLPASLTGLVTIQVLAAGGSDAITVMVNPPATLAVTPTSLQFAATAGGTAPAAQSIQITNSASGTLTWTATASVASSAKWLSVSPASGTAPSTLTVSVSPSGLSAGTYTGSISIAAAGATGSPAAVSVSLVVGGTQPAGAITSVLNAASFQPGFAAATWVSIFGTNLSQSTYTWQTSDFVNGLLPTSLQGVSVTIDGVAAYVEYISPTQINVLAPDDATVGAVQVQVTAAQQASNSFSAPKAPFAPAFFTIAGGAYVAAQHADYSLVGAANLLPGVTTTPAQPGETILLYGTGFGPTNPPLPTAQLVTTPEPLPANSVQISIGGVAATASFAGLVSPGLYQFNVTVPNLPNGDAAVLATINGVATQTGVSVTVQQ
jgi:uncharacterized protein (TIGR03437 family)